MMLHLVSTDLRAESIINTPTCQKQLTPNSSPLFLANMWSSIQLPALIILATAIGVLGDTDAESEKRYAILDNDWLAVSFLPFLMAMKGGMEVLGLVSGYILHHVY
jgi:hypothetical protein